MGASILLTQDPDVNFVAFVEDNGDLELLGYNRDEDFEWGVTVNKGQKDVLLLSLLKRNFQADVTFCAWLEEMGIPYQVNQTTDVQPCGP